jgi:transposase-like protein
MYNVAKRVSNGNKRAKYEEAYQRDLVQQVLVGGKTATQVSSESGIDISSIYGCIRKFRAATDKEDVCPGNGKLTSQDDELRRLRRRVSQLEKECEVKKKPFFAVNFISFSHVSSH